MLKPSADLIIDPSQSRYALVVGIAKRAREIVEEAEKADQILVEKPVDLAVHDFMDQKYKIVEPPIANDDDDEEDEYKIVGSQEADPFESKISNESPIAKAILNKKVGDIVTVDSPNGSYQVKITNIK